MTTTAGLSLRRDQTARDQRADPKERTKAQRRDDPTEQHHRMTRRESGHHVLADVQHPQADQDFLTARPSRRLAQRDCDTQRVPGDHPAHCRLGHRETLRHLRQQPGNQEVGQADAETAERRRDESNLHPLFSDRMPGASRVCGPSRHSVRIARTLEHKGMARCTATRHRSITLPPHGHRVRTGIRPLARPAPTSWPPPRPANGSPPP